jgi:hypothetical protein
MFAEFIENQGGSRITGCSTCLDPYYGGSRYVCSCDCKRKLKMMPYNQLEY